MDPGVLGSIAIGGLFTVLNGVVLGVALFFRPLRATAACVALLGLAAALIAIVFPDRLSPGTAAMLAFSWVGFWSLCLALFTYVLWIVYFSLAGEARTRRARDWPGYAAVAILSSLLFGLVPGVGYWPADWMLGDLGLPSGYLARAVLVAIPLAGLLAIVVPLTRNAMSAPDRAASA